MMQCYIGKTLLADPSLVTKLRAALHKFAKLLRICVNSTYYILSHRRHGMTASVTIDIMTAYKVE